MNSLNCFDNYGSIKNYITENKDIKSNIIFLVTIEFTTDKILQFYIPMNDLHTLEKSLEYGVVFKMYLGSGEIEYVNTRHIVKVYVEDRYEV